MSKLRLERFGPPSIGLADLNNWFDLYKKIPDDLDEPLVIHFESGVSSFNNPILEFDEGEDQDGFLFDSQIEFIETQQDNSEVN